MSKTGVIALAALTCMAGMATGIAIGARHPSRGPSSTASPSSVGEKRLDAQPGTSSPAGPEEKKPESPTETQVEASTEVQGVAQEMWDLMTSKDSTQAAHKERRMRIRDLRPELAKFFILKYRELANSTSVQRQYALEMAIACGGPDAAAFVEEIASTPVEGFQEFMLRTVVSDVLNYGHLMRRPKEFPVGDSLMSRVQILLVAPSPSDRRLAVVILGFSDPARAVPAITERLRMDPDPVVREAAIRELGRIGNEASLDFLRAHGTAIAEQIFATYVQPQPVRGGAPVRGVDKGNFLKILSDAIEELEERLQKK